MLHGILALAAGGQQVLLRTHRAWMPSEAKARPYDTAVSKFHSIAFIFFAMPSVLVHPSLFLECLKVRAAYRSCRLSTWSDGCCSLLAAFSDWFVWVYLAAVWSSLFSANYVGNPGLGLAPVSVGQLTIEPISRLPNFSEGFDAVGPLRLDCQIMHDDP